MKNKTLEPKTDTQPNLSPYQAERAEAQETPVLRPDPLAATLAPPGSEATVRAHAAGLNRATAGRTLRRLQRQYGNRYVQRVVAQRQGGAEGFQLDDETAGRINHARGGGQPLDGAVQAHMSETLGHDFSGVRVHTDPEAHTLNRLLSARAFTTGHDIFFRHGEYNPGFGSGRELIAHELSHVVQQSTGRVSGGGDGMTVRPAGDAFEQEAEVLGRRAARATIKSTLQRAMANPALVAPAGILALQRTVDNGAVMRLLANSPQNGEAEHPTLGKPPLESNGKPTGDHVQAALREEVRDESGAKVRDNPGQGEKERVRANNVRKAGPGRMVQMVQRMAVVMEPNEVGHRVALQAMDYQPPLVDYLDLVTDTRLQGHKGTRLTMLGHASTSEFGGIDADLLVRQLLEDSGLDDSTIKRIELIGCAATVKGIGSTGHVTQSYAEQVKLKLAKYRPFKDYDVMGLALPQDEEIRARNLAGTLDSVMFLYIYKKEYLFIVGDRHVIPTITERIRTMRKSDHPGGVDAEVEEQRQKAEKALLGECGERVYYKIGKLALIRPHLARVGSVEAQQEESQEALRGPHGELIHPDVPEFG